MIAPPISGAIRNKTKIISIGQAPGIHEKEKMMPFSYTAGKTLFKWFSRIGISESEFRKKVNMSAVCRCFPGKAKAGDRKPDKEEIKNCSSFLEFEIKYHKPELIIPIGKLAIEQIFTEKNYKLESIIGKEFQGELYGHSFIWIPLPHPSGLNVWNNTPIGQKKIAEALSLFESNQVIKETFY
ncbi:MAG: uracil-DNA glycosylase family protein [Leptospiraceae bacterium]|nr:uracil-DNA glycosylase family protein [Leptospiraceae bacterium]